jgi:ergothioneine biosynthesis protein EgtB
VRAGGYENPVHWLSDGWATVQGEGWKRPIYWSASLDAEFTLTGLRGLNPHSPVCHLSYYEADAFAHWAGARLPSEAEWELAANEASLRGNFVENRRWHPEPPRASTAGADKPGSPLLQMFGDVWEWTQSAYAPYPGFTPAKGALGEYNGKFMVNQLVLRGGSCATPASHIRASYRNFFNPAARWQFTGLRLARDV